MRSCLSVQANEIIPYRSFWPEVCDLLTNYLMCVLRYEAVWAGEEQNKPLISREMCCIDVLNVVQAQGMLLQCLPCGGVPVMGPPSHPIPVLLVTLSLPVLWLSPKPWVLCFLPLPELSLQWTVPVDLMEVCPRSCMTLQHGSGIVCKVLHMEHHTKGSG